MGQQDEAVTGRDGDEVKGILGHLASPSLGHNATLSCIVRGKWPEDCGFRIANLVMMKGVSGQSLISTQESEFENR
jgi:hypothetical protein